MKGCRLAKSLVNTLGEIFGDRLIACDKTFGEVTIEVAKDDLIEVAKELRDHDDLKFEQLIDLSAVDYLDRKAHV